MAPDADKINGEHGVILSKIKALSDKMDVKHEALAQRSDERHRAMGKRIDSAVQQMGYMTARVDQAVSRLQEHGKMIATIDSRCAEREKANDKIQQRLARHSDEITALGGSVDTDRIEISNLEIKHQVKEKHEREMAEAVAREREIWAEKENARKSRNFKIIMAVGGLVGSGVVALIIKAVAG